MWNSASFLNSVSVVALWVAALSGGLAVVSSFVGGLAAYRASDLTRNDAEIKIAKANARAEEAHLRALQIQKDLAWRELTPEQRKAIADAVRGKLTKVYNTFIGKDPEVTSFRNQLDAALKEGGVETLFFSGWSQAYGVRVEGKPGPERDALSDALDAAHISHSVGESQQKETAYFSKDFPALIIGTKPERL